MTEDRRSRITALAFLAVVPTLLFLDVLTGFNALYVRDVAQFHYPARSVLREIVLGGEMPYWNPYFAAGQPLAANPEHQVFYPLTWLIFLPPLRFFFQLQMIVHVYIATFAMYALLRSKDIGRPASTLGALSFGIGGLLMSTLNVHPYLFSIAWLPLTCLFARRHLLHGSRRDFVLASFFFGIQLLVGEPATVLQTGAILGMYALSRGVKELVPVALMCVAALAISAVQILPAFDHFNDSIRARGIPLADASQWSLPFARLGELVYPDLFGHAADDRPGAFRGQSLYPGTRLPFYYGIYPGLLIIAAALAGFVVRRRGAALAGAMIAVSILVALGSHTPVFEWLYDAGIVRFLRFPEKFLAMAIFVLTVFGAHVIDDLLRADARPRKAMLAVIASVALFALAAALIERGRVEWLIAGARAVVLLVIIGVALRVRPALVVPALAIFTVLDLAPVSFRVAPRMPSAFYDPPAVAQRFPIARDDFRIFHHAAWRVDAANAGPYYGRRAERPWVLRNALEPNATAAHGLRTVVQSDIAKTSLLPSADFNDAVWMLANAHPPGWIDSVAAMSNIRYVGIFRPFAKALADAGGDFTKIQPVQFIEGRRYPRYYFATELVTIRDMRDFVGKLASNRFGKQAAFVGEPAFTPAAGTVLGWTETANTARIEVEASGDAFLVMSVTPHKYWEVTIDAQPVSAVVTNIGYQGVVVPRGRHVVEMRYKNPLIAAGAAISAAALIALAALARRT